MNIGAFRARLVACGYSQVPGIDYNESFAPAVNDVSSRIMIIVKLIWKLQASTTDVETAFLHGNLQEEIYISLWLTCLIHDFDSSIVNLDRFLFVI